MTMRVGIVLPTFADTADAALGAASDAEAHGLHGVFAYDHLWPMGHPGRPALSPFPVLGAVAMRTTSVAVGTLVARVGLRPDDVLLEELASLQALSLGRLVAGIGTGDAKSAAENLAYGVAFSPARDRRERLAAVARALVEAGISTWVGAGQPATDLVARRSGAVLNMWGASPAVVAASAEAGPVSWGGMLPREPGDAARLFAELARAGATWAVVGWPGSVAPVVAAAQDAGVALG